MELIPDYDQLQSNKSVPNPREHFHEDLNISSPIFNDLLVSFRWRPLINDALITDLQRLANLDDRQSPQYVFLGATVHNMMQRQYNLSDRPFEDVVQHELLPVLLQCLENHPQMQIIWLHQTPTTDTVGPVMDERNVVVHIHKIRNFNNVIWRLFKGTGIVIWDSYIPAIEEYLRGCALTRFSRNDLNQYIFCTDYLHPGFGVLSFATQIIFNHICSYQ